MVDPEGRRLAGAVLVANLLVACSAPVDGTTVLPVVEVPAAPVPSALPTPAASSPAAQPVRSPSTTTPPAPDTGSTTRPPGSNASGSSPSSHPAKETPLALRTWYLSFDGAPMTLVLPSTPAPTSGSIGAKQVASDGMLVDGSGASSVVDSVIGPDADGKLSFRTSIAGATAWVRGRITEGVLSGRWAEGGNPSSWTAFDGHVTGWNAGFFDQRSSRVFHVTVGGSDLVTLRIDRAASGDGFVGRWKRYGTTSGGAWDESLELDLDVTSWDGSVLAFSMKNDDEKRSCTATVDGRDIEGSCTSQAGVTKAFAGHRAEVLSYGLARRSAATREAWQSSTRAALSALLMAGNPEPSAVTVDTSATPQPPIPLASCVPDRDDDVDDHPQAYTRREVHLHATYPSAYGLAAADRAIHGWLAVPTGTPPPAGFPAVVALNGHGGSAYALLDPNDASYWYGDAFARRGWVVLAVDVSHRPVSDRASLYSDVKSGDDPAHGNGPHPAIESGGMDSDWEEDGERAADAMRARELLASLDYVDSSKIAVAGLSLGGEVTTFAAALDPAFATALPAGFSPDIDVIELHGNHPCFRWRHADLGDYVSISDLHALVAPRPLVVATGRMDWVFSFRSTPFSADKQVARRSRAAYADDAAHFVHYLHYDTHHFHAADLDACSTVEMGLRTPALVRPTSDMPVEWQTDDTTDVIAPALFPFLDSP